MDEPLASMPISALFGFRFVEQTAERAQVALPIRPEFLQIEQRVHGGVLATLADTCAVHLLLPGVPQGSAMTSIEFKLNFVRPAVPGLGDVVATATLVRRGRQVCLVDVALEQAGKLVAKGLFTYLVSARD